MYTMDTYVAAYEAADYPNAIAIWDDCAQRIYDHVRRQAGDGFRPSLPSIFSSFMPKSGGTFLFNRMIEYIGYHEYLWGITRRLSNTEFYPTPNAVRCYGQGGVFCHTHVVPSPWFRMVANQVDLGTIWVHVRHPAEACLSSFYHYQGKGQGIGAIAEQRRAQIHEEKKALGWTSENDDLDTFFRSHIHFFCNWLTWWAEYAEDDTNSVFFTYFDELKDPGSLLERVFRRCGRKVDIPEITTADPKDRRRLSGGRDWRAGLSPDTVALVESISSPTWRRVIALRED